MRHCIAVIVVLLLARAAMAQPDSLIKPKIIVSVAPLCLIDIYEGPSLRMSLERTTASRFAWCLDGRYYFNDVSGFVTKTYVNGYAVMPSVKYYFKREQLPWGETVNQYIALQYTYRDQSYSYHDSIRLPSRARIAKTARMQQYTNTLVLMYGGMKTHKSGITIEGYVGIGVRTYSSSSNLTKEEQDGIIDLHDWTDPTEWPIRSVGHWVYPNICGGFKVGYSFK